MRQREIILRNNGTISALGHFQSTGAENFFIMPPMPSSYSMKVQSDPGVCALYMDNVNFYRCVTDIVLTHIQT